MSLARLRAVIGRPHRAPTLVAARAYRRGDVVQVNAEGFTLFGESGDSAGHGIEFSERNVTRLLEHEPMAALGAACARTLAGSSRVGYG